MRMRILKRFLPNLADGFWLLVLLILVATALIAQAAQLTWQPSTIFLFALPLVVAATSVMLGLAVVSGWGRIEWSRWLALFVVSVSCFGFSLYQLQSMPTNVSFERDALDRFVPQSLNFEIANFFENRYQNLTRLVLGLGFIALAVFVTRMLISYLLYLKNRYAFNRQRMLVLVAAVLAICAIGYNVFFAGRPGTPASELHSFSTTHAFATARIVAVFLVFVCWPGYVFSHQTSWSKKAMALLALAGGVAGLFYFLCIFNQYSEKKDLGICILTGIGACLFVMTLVVTSKADASSIATPSLPTVWGVLACVPLIASLVLPLFDLGTLLTYQASGGKSIGGTESVWSVARSIAKANRRSNGHLQIVCPDTIPWNIACCLDCESGTSTDVLKYIDYTSAEQIDIKNINTELETSWIRNRAKSVTIHKGEISKRQLADILNLATGQVRISDVDIVDDGSEYEPAKLGTANIECGLKRSGDLANLFGAIGQTGNKFSVTVFGDLNQEDRLAGIAASKSVKVVLVQRKLPRIQRTSGGDSLADICIYDGPLLPGEIELKLSAHNGWDNLEFDPENSRLFWDATFAIGWPGNRPADTYKDKYKDLLEQASSDVTTETEKQETTERLVAKLKVRHLAFGLDSAERITHLYLPDPTSEFLKQACGLTQLKSLSLDPSWIDSQHLHETQLRLPSSLCKLTDLNELYLAKNMTGKFRFLNVLKELKHLQISPEQLGDSLPGNLESLVLLELPELPLMQKISNLSKLEELTVVTAEETALKRSFKLRAKEMLPQADVKVLDQYEDSLTTQIPQKFKDHRKQVKNELIEQFRRDTQAKNSTK